jgi:hypothetical protein
VTEHTLGVGFSVVETAIIALVLLLIGHKFGLPFSVFHLAIAICVAATLHYVGRKLWRLLTRNS